MAALRRPTATRHHVHDGVIDSLRRGDTDVVELRALIGDLQVGYEWFLARYHGAARAIIEPGFSRGAGIAVALVIIRRPRGH
ncbi:hypothetical protein [Arthrobacter sp. MMS24-S77]